MTYIITARDFEWKPGAKDEITVKSCDPRTAVNTYTSLRLSYDLVKAEVSIAGDSINKALSAEFNYAANYHFHYCTVN